ncbi:MAG: hypothetical protein ISS36_02430 [Candidatus Aenigmarchaeota archaeon]|nr:hypothetical protein [Candidatus Aenigmarchaeota archaeon]
MVVKIRRKRNVAVFLGDIESSSTKISEAYDAGGLGLVENVVEVFDMLLGNGVDGMGGNILTTEGDAFVASIGANRVGNLTKRADDVLSASLHRSLGFGDVYCIEEFNEGGLEYRLVYGSAIRDAKEARGKGIDELRIGNNFQEALKTDKEVRKVSFDDMGDSEDILPLHVCDTAMFACQIPLPDNPDNSNLEQLAGACSAIKGVADKRGGVLHKKIGDNLLIFFPYDNPIESAALCGSEVLDILDDFGEANYGVVGYGKCFQVEFFEDLLGIGIREVLGTGIHEIFNTIKDLRKGGVKPGLFISEGAYSVSPPNIDFYDRSKKFHRVKDISESGHWEHRFVGRESELDELDNWYNGNSSFVNVYGISGIGKTTFLNEFVKHLDGVKKYKINRFANLLAEFGVSIADAPNIRKLKEGIYEAIASNDGILVVDDVGIDSDFIDFFKWVSKKETKLRTVAISREDLGIGTDEYRLGTLSRHDALELAQGDETVLSELKHTGYSPARILLRAGKDWRVADVKAEIMARDVRSLSFDAARGLTRLAVAYDNNNITVEEAESIGVGSELLDEAVEKGVMVLNDYSYSFNDPALVDVLEDNIMPSVSEKIHDEMFDRIETEYEIEVPLSIESLSEYVARCKRVMKISDLTELARHGRGTGNTIKLYASTMAAGIRLREFGLFGESEALYEDALDRLSNYFIFNRLVEGNFDTETYAAFHAYVGMLSGLTRVCSDMDKYEKTDTICKRGIKTTETVLRNINTNDPKHSKFLKRGEQLLFDSLHKRGVCSFASMDYTSAEADFLSALHHLERISEIDPDSYQYLQETGLKIHNSLGRLFEMQGMYEEAREEYVFAYESANSSGNPITSVKAGLYLDTMNMVLGRDSDCSEDAEIMLKKRLSKGDRVQIYDLLTRKYLVHASRLSGPKREKTLGLAERCVKKVITMERDAENEYAYKVAKVMQSAINLVSGRDGEGFYNLREELQQDDRFGILDYIDRIVSLYD